MYDRSQRYERRHPVKPSQARRPRNRILRKGALLGALLFMLAMVGTLVLVATTQAAWPLSGSQVLTIEHGPDGWWHNQSWILDWTPRPPARLTTVYDIAQRSPDLQAWALDYRQWDLSVTVPVYYVREQPWTVTLGRRWRVGVEHGTFGGTGPWTYGMLVVGW